MTFRDGPMGWQLHGDRRSGAGSRRFDGSADRWVLTICTPVDVELQGVWRAITTRSAQGECNSARVVAHCQPCVLDVNGSLTYRENVVHSEVGGDRGLERHCVDSLAVIEGRQAFQRKQYFKVARMNDAASMRKRVAVADPWKFDRRAEPGYRPLTVAVP